MRYTTPELDIIRFEEEDIITVSKPVTETPEMPV